MRAARSLVACAVALVALAACGPRPTAGGSSTAARGKELRELLLDEAPVEASGGGLFGAPTPTVREVVSAIDAARTDANVGGVFLRVGPMGGAFGRIEDMSAAFRALRAAGKPVHCHFEVTDNSGYALLASSCDRISMTPAGDLDLVGVAAHLFYAKRLLDSVGITADLMQMGRFKGAAEPFTREEMSPETRESMGALLDDLEAGVVGAIATGRRLEPAAVQRAIDDGPHDSASARDARLVDAVAFDDEARARAKEAAHAERVVRVSLREEGEAFDFDAFVKALSGETPQATTRQSARVALVYLDGEISDGETPTGRGSGTSGPFVAEMRRLADDANVKAVVLRIDSPGGSALASDRMWHAVRRVAGRKPVIVSIGDMAASGGYYIACAGTEILAHDTSIVGSIGVVGGKVAFAGLAERIGVDTEILRRGTNSGWSSPTAPFSDSERAIVQRMLRTTYARFLSRVGSSRHLDAARVSAAAEGRIWSGKRGRALGLVDRAGSLSDALRTARERGHLADDAPIEVWPARRTIVDLLAQALGTGGTETRALAPATPEDALRALAAALGPIGGGLARLFALAPLVRGDEHVVVAVPFALDLR
jgi:protease-4